MHRIPYGKEGPDTYKNGEANVTRPVVFVQHGLLCSSADFVLSDPPKALGVYICRDFSYHSRHIKPTCTSLSYIFSFSNVAFILSDAGYDVWLGNYRGNTYSRAHEHLDPEELDFWQFR